MKMKVLTHNSTGARIGNDVIMPSTAALYLLHLPKDVLAYVPLQGIENSLLGNAARGGNWFENFIVGVRGLAIRTRFGCIPNAYQCTSTILHAKVHGKE
jgi:hypothetical protein